jgi:hypothetical protein
MEEGQMTWGRVYNDIADQNLTMASTRPSSAPSGDLEPLIQAVQAAWRLGGNLLPHPRASLLWLLASITTALAWPEPTHRSLLRRYTTSQPMAYCTLELLRLRSAP